MDPVQLVLSRLSERGHEPRQSGDRWSCRCPAHEGKHRDSLSITAGDNGGAVVHCFSGCTTEAVVGALGLQTRDLFADSGNGHSPKPKAKKPSETFATAEAAVASKTARRGPPVGTWQYRDADGDLVGVVCRWNRADGRKDYLPFSRQADGKWTCQGMPSPRPLYRLPEVLQAETVYVCEGEKAADALGSLGLIPTTSAHGAKSADKTDWSPMAGKSVVIVPDHDEEGEKYASDVVALATEAGASSVVIARLADVWPGMPAGGDAHDWIEHHDATDPETFRGILDSLVSKADLVTAIAEPADATPSEKPEWQPFPVDSLPEPVRSFVLESAESMRIDPAFVVLPLLPALAAAIGTSRKVSPRPEWVEACVLWSAIVAESGSGKTHGWSSAMQFTKEQETICEQANRERKRQYDQALKLYKAQYEAWKKEFSKNGGGFADLPPIEPEPFVPDKRVVMNPTAERVGSLLSGNRRGLILSRDELSGWIASMDRYISKRGAGGDAATWLEFYQANAGTIERQTGDLYVPYQSCSACGGIQPKVAARSLLGEHADNGLLPRFSLACPPESERVWKTEPVSFSTREAMRGLVATLYGIPLRDDGPNVLCFDYDAEKVFEPFYVNYDFEGTRGVVRSMLNKNCGLAARLALVVHTIRETTDSKLPSSIDAESITAGITMAKWFAYEWRRVFRILQSACLEEGDNAHDVDHRLLAHVQKHGGRVTARDAEKGCSWIPTSDDAEAALNRLVKAGLGHWQNKPPTDKGGRPTRQFVAGPSA